jgi:hypothetical protein
MQGAFFMPNMLKVKSFFMISFYFVKVLLLLNIEKKQSKQLEKMGQSFYASSEQYALEFLEVNGYKEGSLWQIIKNGNFDFNELEVHIEIGSKDKTDRILFAVKEWVLSDSKNLTSDQIAVYDSGEIFLLDEHDRMSYQFKSWKNYMNVDWHLLNTLFHYSNFIQND